MRDLLEWLGSIDVAGFSAVEWIAILAMAVLVMIGVLLVVQRLAGVGITWHLVRRTRTAPSNWDRLPAGHEKILIVDDDAGVRESTARILRELGYNTVTVEDGLSAVHYMEQNGADLILLDMRMEPGLSGIETFRRIRELRPLQKAIVMTAYAGPTEIAAVRAMGIQHYIIKPAPLTLLARAIREELDGP